MNTAVKMLKHIENIQKERYLNILCSNRNPSEHKNKEKHLKELS